MGKHFGLPPETYTVSLLKSHRLLVINRYAPGKVDAKIYYRKIKGGTVKNSGPRHVRRYGSVQIQGKGLYGCGFNRKIHDSDYIQKKDVRIAFAAFGEVPERFFKIFLDRYKIAYDNELYNRYTVITVSEARRVLLWIKLITP
jgi:hypothetical protein